MAHKEYNVGGAGFNRVTMDVEEFRRRFIFDPEFLRTLRVDRDEAIDMMLDREVYTLAVSVASDSYRQDETVEMTRPATWWDHLKHDLFPGWLLRAFPARYETERRTFTLAHIRKYPGIALPPGVDGRYTVSEYIHEKPKEE